MTFAGSPDRVEAQLVPERGFELDTFRVAGFPRRPGAAARARARARGCARRSPAARSSRGDGPTSCSAAAATSPGRWCSRRGRERIPAALTEADAHLGLANRLAAPFADRVFLALPDRRARAATKYRVVGRPVPARRARRDRATRRAPRSGCRADGPVVLVFGGSLGAARR